MDIRNIDLNLLPVLDALIRHRSVSRAALELGMSQSATSAALARLRTLIGDPLFVRTGRGLLPTARTGALSGALAAIVASVRDDVLQATAFDPATSRRTFRLLLSDVGAYVLWPRIVQTVRAQAPRARLALQTVAGGSVDIATRLREGQADLAIGAYPGLPDSLMQQRLFDRDFVALVRIGHPALRRRLGLEAFARLPHIAVHAASGTQERIDAVLAGHGLRRDEVIDAPSYLTVPPLLEAGDFVAVLPGQLADAFAAHGRLTTLKLPFALPATTVRMHWHRRFHDDPAIAWLRRAVATVLGERARRRAPPALS